MNDDLTPREIEKTLFHPENNHNVISIIKQEDGNWRGFTWKNGRLVQVRQGDPMTVLQLLITSD